MPALCFILCVYLLCNCVLIMWLCTNCVLVPHYQLIRLCNCKLGTSPECPCPLIIEALDNCQNFNLGQTNLPRMIQMQMNKEGISKLGNINFRTQFFIFQPKFWHLCWHPKWHTFTKAFEPVFQVFRIFLYVYL